METVTITLNNYNALKENQNRLTLSDAVNYKCPFCKHSNTFHKHTQGLGTKIESWYCDEESGGCGEKLLIETTLSAKISTKVFKYPKESE